MFRDEILDSERLTRPRNRRSPTTTGAVGARHEGVPRVRRSRAWWAGSDTLVGMAVRVVLAESVGAECVVTPDVAEASRRAADGELVLVAFERPAGDSHRAAAREWLERRPGVAHVAIAPMADERTARSLLAEGWTGVILASAGRAEVVAALQRLAAGDHVVAGSHLGPDACARLCDPRRYWPGVEHGLSRRESEVLVGLADGLSTDEIASRLVLGRETVRTHLRTLYRSLGVARPGIGGRRGLPARASSADRTPGAWPSGVGEEALHPIG